MTNYTKKYTCCNGPYRNGCGHLPECKKHPKKCKFHKKEQPKPDLRNLEPLTDEEIHTRWGLVRTCQAVADDRPAKCGEWHCIDMARALKTIEVLEDAEFSGDPTVAFALRERLKAAEAVCLVLENYSGQLRHLLHRSVYVEPIEPLLKAWRKLKGKEKEEKEDDDTTLFTG